MKNLLKKISIMLSFAITLTFSSPILEAKAYDKNIVNRNNISEFNPPKAGEITYLSDREVADILIENGYEINEFEYPFLLQRANGYNKIVWKNNGFDLYISKNTLLLLSGAGIGALTVLIAAFPPLGGAGSAIIGGAIGSYVGGNISDGKIFHFKYRDGNKLAPYLDRTSTQY